MVILAARILHPADGMAEGAKGVYCGHEYLLAYSCKRRCFCTSCHTKRAVTFAEWLHETVLWPVAPRQIVLTITKMLRAYYDRWTSSPP